MIASVPMRKGFAVVPGPFGVAQLPHVLNAIDRAVAQAEAAEINVGSTRCNVRTEGMLDRAPVLAALFTHEPLNRVATEIIGSSFRLSGFHLRTVLPGAAAQQLHQDVAPGYDGWPLVGFIFMVDEFCNANGATRFVPNSEALGYMPHQLLTAHPSEELACGPVGSMVIFNGSVWHGFGANVTSMPRRSIYGALIPGDATPSRDYAATLPDSIWPKLSDRARDVLFGTPS